MAKRYNISLPDRLAAKYEPFKNLISLSEVCQEALGTLINNINDVADRIESVDALSDKELASLVRDAKKYTQDLRSLGIKAGMEWAKEASYYDFANTLPFAIYKWLSVRDKLQFVWNDERLIALMESKLKEAEYEGVEFFTHDNQFTIAAKHWITGYYMGVAQYYDEIKDRLEEMSEK